MPHFLNELNIKRSISSANRSPEPTKNSNKMLKNVCITNQKNKQANTGQNLVLLLPDRKMSELHNAFKSGANLGLPINNLRVREESCSS